MPSPLARGPADPGRSPSPVTTALSAAAAALVLGWLGPLGYPLRLLTTLVHELAHGVMALLTGGRFLQFVVFPDGSGVATTAGGWRLLIIPAGYLGVAVVATGLIMLGRGRRSSRAALGVVGAALALLTLVAGVGLGALLVLAALRLADLWALFLLNLLAFYLGLSAFGDLWMLFGITTAAGAQPLSDAAAMARITFIPAPLWAVAWAAMAAAALGWALWRAWLRPQRGSPL